MARTNNTFKSIAALSAGLAAWTIFAFYTINATTGPMVYAVKAMA